MHIVIGFLTALLTLLYVLERLGIDVGWFNPFGWRRRRAWARRYQGDPIYSIDAPIDLAAIFVVGAVRVDGDLSAEQKQGVRRMFAETFSLSDKEAADLVGSAAHLIGAPQVASTQLEALARMHRGTFSAEQAASVVSMAESLAAADGSVSPTQREYLDGIRSMLTPEAPQGSWA